MKCKNHPNRDAEQFCTSCGIPLCGDCAEESKPGEFYCFQCAMLHSVSEMGTSLSDKHDKAAKKKLVKKKAWGPFQYFMIVAGVLVVVMWSVIIFGSTDAPSGKTIDYAKQERVFLFMVNTSIKRYAHFKGNKYPDNLEILVPKYLRMKEEEIHHLKRLSYKKSPKTGYHLTLANPKPGSMKVIITPKGIKYQSPSSEGV